MNVPLLKYKTFRFANKVIERERERRRWEGERGGGERERD